MAFDRKFIAGAFGVTWNALNLGYTEAGFNLLIEFADNIPIVEDRYGEAEIDAIFQGGIRSLMLNIESLYWSADVQNSAVPFLTSFDGGKIAHSPGKLLVRSDLAKPIILTPKTGVAKTDDKSWSFFYGYSVETISLDFSSRTLRRSPLGFKIWPQKETDDANELTWWTRA